MEEEIECIYQIVKSRFDSLTINYKHEAHNFFYYCGDGDKNVREHKCAMRREGSIDWSAIDLL